MITFEIVAYLYNILDFASGPTKPEIFTLCLLRRSLPISVVDSRIVNFISSGHYVNTMNAVIMHKDVNNFILP